MTISACSPKIEPVFTSSQTSTATKTVYPTITRMMTATPTHKSPSVLSTETSQLTITANSTPTPSKTELPTTTPTQTQTPKPTPTENVYSIVIATASALPTSSRIRDFSLVSSEEAWFVGNDGFIGHWGGQEWVETTSPTTYDLHAVEFISPDNGWAVGEGAQMLHWDGSTWTILKPYREETYLRYYLDSVTYVDPTEIWAVGSIDSEGSSGPYVVHWKQDNQIWYEVDAGTIQTLSGGWLRSIDMVTASDGWLVGSVDDEAGIFHWDGTNWSYVTFPDPENSHWFNSVSILAADSVWVGGSKLSYTGTSISYLLRWDGQQWEEMTLVNSNDNRIRKVVMVSETEGWILDMWSNILFWDGTRWQSVLKTSNQGYINIGKGDNGGIWAVTTMGEIVHFLPKE